MIVPGMGSSSYQLAYKGSQGGDDAINFSFPIKPSSENMIVTVCVCVVPGMILDTLHELFNLIYTIRPDKM